MTKTMRNGGSSISELTVDTTGLARLLWVSGSNVEKRAAKRAWLSDELPVPIEVAGCRRWYVPAVEAWLDRKVEKAEKYWLRGGAA